MYLRCIDFQKKQNIGSKTQLDSSLKDMSETKKRSHSSMDDHVYDDLCEEHPQESEAGPSGKKKSKQEKHEIEESLARPFYSAQDEARLKEENALFFLLVNFGPFQELIRIISGILKSTRVRFLRKMINGVPTNILNFQNTNENKTAMIIAKMKLDQLFTHTQETADECIYNVDFLIDCNSLLRVMSNPNNTNCSMELMLPLNSEDVVVHLFKHAESNYDNTSRLKKLVSDIDKAEYKINLRAYARVVRMEVTALLNIVRAAKTTAKFLQITLREGFDAAKQNCLSSLEFSYTSDDLTESTFSYKSYNKYLESDNQIVISMNDFKSENLIQIELDPQPVYSESFSIEYLHSFLKSMSGDLVIMYMESEKPLVLRYYLGGDKEVGAVDFMLALRDDSNDG